MALIPSLLDSLIFLIAPAGLLGMTISMSPLYMRDPKTEFCQNSSWLHDAPSKISRFLLMRDLHLEFFFSNEISWTGWIIVTIMSLSCEVRHDFGWVRTITRSSEGHEISAKGARSTWRAPLLRYWLNFKHLGYKSVLPPNWWSFNRRHKFYPRNS